uniref:Uncharacterized protein n=1 Tax=Anguilla anguilla TaxID=7936 RepID=A0A0E9PVS9_ANGAN
MGICMLNGCPFVLVVVCTPINACLCFLTN